nr:rho-related GTP-binding protein RhoF isoform X2 [Salvelinus alpinus]
MTENGTMTSNGTAKKGEELKIVIVGDGGCGKTSLLMVYAKGDFPEKYAPSVFEKYVTTVKYGGKEIRLNLYDTAGQDDYDRLRPLSYQNANLVLVCYDVTNPTSFENVLIKHKLGLCWKPPSMSREMSIQSHECKQCDKDMWNAVRVRHLVPGSEPLLSRCSCHSDWL